MRGKAVRLAAVAILAASQMAIGERAFARAGGSASMSHGHSVGGRHFAHGRFDHRFRRNSVFFAPYGWGWDWPYADYSDIPSANYANTAIVPYPPPALAGRTADNCHWNEDSFDVPSSVGGTRPIKVVSCR